MAHTSVLGDFDEELWKAVESRPEVPLPENLCVLETFAGCGGMHMNGFVKMGGKQVGINTVCAVEIEEEPHTTFKTNFPEVNCLNMGVSRFLATGRRLLLSKQPAKATKDTRKVKVIDMRINNERALAVLEANYKGSELHRQDKDYVSLEDFQGKTVLPWLEYLVETAGSGKAKPASWQKDSAEPHFRAAVSEYLNSSSFGPHKFPLPGDVQVVTGGPPCQGWSGYNTTRNCSKDAKELFQHVENRLVCRFLEVIWFYEPLYLIMEETVTTGRYGCPQTRDRLIMIGSQKGLVQPNIPEPIMSKFKDDEVEIALAFKRSNIAYPIDMNFRKLELEASQARAAAVQASPEESAASGAAEGPEPEEPSSELPEEFKTYLGDPDDRKALMKWKREKNAAIAKMKRERDAWARAQKQSMKKKAAKEAVPPTRDVDMMRALVLGDSLSCDLPAEVEGFRQGQKSRSDMEETVTTYLTPPPTPYIQYLRQGAPKTVSNHYIYELGVSDQLRCNCVPMRGEASWRDMAGDDEENCPTQLAPLMMELTDDEWSSLCSRTVNKIPEFMLEDPDERVEAGKLPKLKKPWSLKPKRFPLVPYWCLTMKNGKDQGCYGRLSYKEPHDTVHSYHKPHWHPSLVPFNSRVMTVREKARIQGFPDKFVFCGEIGKQYKQIGNAVSPQLAKALAQSLLTSHLAKVQGSRPAPSELSWSPSLRNFKDFLAGFDLSKMPKLERHTPVESPRPPLSPMTYEEVLVWYNTEQRTDHSTRNSAKTPFQVLTEAEDHHQWHLRSIVGIRNPLFGQRNVRVRSRDPEAFENYLELGAYYHGFKDVEWVDFTQDYTKTEVWQVFHSADPEKVDEVMGCKSRAFCLDGVDSEAEARVHPALVAAEQSFKKLEERYETEKKAGADGGCTELGGAMVEARAQTGKKAAPAKKAKKAAPVPTRTPLQSANRCGPHAIGPHLTIQR
eukprot:gene14462-17092_t